MLSEVSSRAEVVALFKTGDELVIQPGGTWKSFHLPPMPLSRCKSDDFLGYGTVVGCIATRGAFISHSQPVALADVGRVLEVIAINHHLAIIDADVLPSVGTIVEVSFSVGVPGNPFCTWTRDTATAKKERAAGACNASPRWCESTRQPTAVFSFWPQEALRVLQ